MGSESTEDDGWQVDGKAEVLPFPQASSCAVLCVLRASVVRFDVDGIVVGAMGCFPTQSVGPKSGAGAPGIFGLYLLRWLRERKAAA